MADNRCDRLVRMGVWYPAGDVAAPDLLVSALCVFRLHFRRNRPSPRRNAGYGFRPISQKAHSLVLRLLIFHPLLAHCHVLLSVGLWAILFHAAGAADATPTLLEHFESRIRPVLVEQCYSCHNSHGETEGGLALDHRAGLLAGGTAGPIVVPGNSSASRLLAVLRHEIPDLEMPQDGPQLDAETIADFERWIAAGAVDPRDQPPTAGELAAATSWAQTLERRKQWWSFQPITQPHPPEVDDLRWARHPIDRFVDARRQAAGLEASARATPAVLVRRLYFALTGLPPSRRAAHDWTGRLTDASEEQFQQVLAELVDELLASERFAERWARHWMDWIRYAESHGSEGDPETVGAWHYRDYLLRALDADVPVDQLIREHVAGDLLDEPRRNDALGINESAIGPAHWRMVFHGFAPTDALDEKVRFVDDQINTFSKAFLGLTVSCARCHDHKFDAISQRDYYALFGVLASCRPGRTTVDLPERINLHRRELAELKSKIREAVIDQWTISRAEIAARLLAAEELWTEEASRDLFSALTAMQTTLAEGKSPKEAWQSVISLASPSSEQQAAFDEATIWSADFGETNDYAQWFRAGVGLAAQPQPAGGFAVALDGEQALEGVYPSGVYSHGISTKHPARLLSEDLELDEPAELWVLAAGDGEARVRYVVQDYPRDGTVYRVQNLTDRWQWQRLDLTYWQGDRIHIEIATAMDTPLLVRDQPRSWFAVREARLVRPGAKAPDPGRDVIASILRLAEAEPPQSLKSLADLYAAAIDEALKAWQVGSIDDQQAMLLDACRRANILPKPTDRLPGVEPFVEQYRQLEAEIPVATRVPGVDERTPRDQPLLVRGDHRQPGEPVPRRFLEAIDPTPYPSSGSGRLQLAADLLRDDNPLTRRVLANRIWHHLFGQGIVRTPNNFGKLGDRPSHPELLDWLATRLVEHGWSLKGLIREIVLTETWQLSSQPPENAAARDPENRLLTYRKVQRLEAEAIRDLLLTLSGKLEHQLGGEPVPGSAPRRSIYVAVRRNELDPFLRTFDFPEPFTAVGRRSATNVPAQALAMLNDSQASQWVGEWAARVLDDDTLSDDGQRIGAMYLAAFSRDPTQEEVQRCQDFLTVARQEVAAKQQQWVNLQRQVDQYDAAIERLVARAVERSTERDSLSIAGLLRRLPEPVAHWNFLERADDLVAANEVQLVDGARLTSEGLELRDGAYAVTKPLAVAIKAKTLAAWVQMDNLDQRGGGVMTVQTADGTFFDAIVFGEQSPRKWLAGSNNFARTQPFGGAAEQQADAQPVHLAIVYHADGQVAGYRNGHPYGQPYQSDGPFQFEKGRAVVSFGVRHLPPVGNRLLTGRILGARLYDRALQEDEVAAIAQAGPGLTTWRSILDALPPEARARLEQVQADRAAVKEKIRQFENAGSSDGPEVVWTELALALTTLKELIYVR